MQAFGNFKDPFAKKLKSAFVVSGKHLGRIPEDETGALLHLPLQFLYGYATPRRDSELHLAFMIEDENPVVVGDGQKLTEVASFARPASPRYQELEAFVRELH